ncbi:dihydroorotate dehydrogenase 2 [Rhodopirellula maiorica SM1]|uniref:Dihydroorotate dehydrogenase 2 n=1 Tax=Rhodopirellula maiorica SM1 TaxID=1265738 RepID=M5RT73_9BACT|nr:dihydroorotate dehydrogenase-like protein [Rhodopirellula maiorica]EMI18587.1 dihydroorotate dehydrogenase 2 [Rhodopirellula maiorica SM1]
MPSELACCYLGMELESPVLVGSCPLTMELETVRQLVDAGAGAIVLPSILQEQILYSRLLKNSPEHAIERSGYQPQQDRFNGGTEKYLQTIETLRANESVPIIASMDGIDDGDWIGYAKEIEASGANALEFNWHPAIFSPSESAEEIEERVCVIVRHLCASVSIPVAVKLSQRFTNLASMARKLQIAGADGVVLFSHLPQWDVSVDRGHWTIRWELSPINSLGLILEGIVRTRASEMDLQIAASGGVRSAEDAIKTMIAGADVVMVTSEVYREGPEVIRNIVQGISKFLDTGPYPSLADFLHARPVVKLGPKHLMRLSFVDPHTRSEPYFDPTPVVTSDTGDAFGHKHT